MEEDRPVEKRTVKYAFWKNDNAWREPKFQVLYDKMLLDHDQKQGVAPPVEIKEQHDNLSYDELKLLYPCPPESAIPKAKRSVE